MGFDVPSKPHQSGILRFSDSRRKGDLDALRLTVKELELVLNEENTLLGKEG